MSGSSDYTLTPKLGLYKPTFDADVDQWGMHWNSNADVLDASVMSQAQGDARYLQLSGGTLSSGQTVTTSVNSQLTANWTLSGAQTTGNPFGWTFSLADSLDARSLSAFSAFYIEDVLRAGAAGGRNALAVVSSLQAPTTGDPARFNNVVSIYGTTNQNHGGTSGAAALNLVGLASEIWLSAGATYLNIVEAIEAGVGIEAGASAGWVNGIKLSPQKNGVSPIYSFVAYGIGGIPPPGEPFHIGFDFCTVESGPGNYGIKSNGTLMASSQAGTVQHGINLTNVTFTGNAFASNGYTVSGAGRLTAKGAQITNGLELSNPSGSLVMDNAVPIWWFDAAGHIVTLTLGSDNNMQFYGTDASGGQRLIWNMVQENSTSPMIFSVPVTASPSLGVGGAAGPTWTTGSAAPSSTQPVGSLYSRVGGAVGATLYVSRGGGTWAAVAGV